MQEILKGSERTRDPAQERRERHRYWLLAGVRERSGSDPRRPVSGLKIGEALGLSREETFRQIQFLAQQGLLHYDSAGPRVRITEAGIAYLEAGDGPRRSIRNG